MCFQSAALAASCMIPQVSGLLKAAKCDTCLQEADEDGSGELDLDEFCEKLGPYLGQNLSREQIVQLFMKIDADAGGTVDWWVGACWGSSECAVH